MTNAAEGLSDRDYYTFQDGGDQMRYDQQDVEEGQDASAGDPPAAVSPLHIMMVSTPLCLMVYFCITQSADKKRNQAEEQNIIQSLAIAVVVGMLFFGGVLLSHLAGQVLAPYGFLSALLMPVQLTVPLALPVGFLAIVV